MATFVFSTTGNDVSGTGSSANPYRTLSKAWTSAVSIGDHVQGRGGTYIGGTGDLDTNSPGPNRGRDGVIVENFAGEAMVLSKAFGGSANWDLKNVRNCIFRKNPSGGSFSMLQSGTFGTEVNDNTVAAIRIRKNTALTTGTNYYNCENNVFDGLTIGPVFGIGILLNLVTSNTVQNCDISGTWCAVHDRDSFGSIIQSNVLHDNQEMLQNDPSPTTNDVGGEAVGLNGATGFLVRKNECYGNFSRTGSFDYGTDGGCFDLYNIPDDSLGGIIGGAPGDGNICYNNHGFLETGRDAANTTRNNGRIEVSYNLVYGRNDYQAEGLGRSGDFSPTTPLMLLRAFVNGNIHHNTFDVADGASGDNGIRFNQSGGFQGNITGITLRNNAFRVRFSTPVYNFQTNAIPASMVADHNVIYYTFDYGSNVLVRSGTDYTLTQLAAAQASTGLFAGDIWGDTNTNTVADPKFKDATNVTMSLRDYTPLVGSSLTGAASDGSDIGAIPFSPISGGPPPASTTDSLTITDVAIASKARGTTTPDSLQLTDASVRSGSVFRRYPVGP